VQGHYVRTLGNIGDKDTENEVLLLEHDIPHAHFSADVLNCLPQMPWSISKEVRWMALGPVRYAVEHTRFLEAYRPAETHTHTPI